MREMHSELFDIRAAVTLTAVAALLATWPVLGTAGGAAFAQEAADGEPEQQAMGDVTLERLFSDDFQGEFLGATRWLDGGSAYTTLEAAEGDGENGGNRGLELIRYETSSGDRDVLVSAAELTPEGRERPLRVQGYDWSADGDRLLIFTNTRRVWRQNTRGDYWVLDREEGTLTQLGGDAAESSLMFAKFSPDGTRVAYRAEYDLYVEDLRTGAITRLTDDGSRTIINGTFDWVYEEEFSARDGFRWSPDGSRIAYWQLDAEGVRDFLMINNTDSLYSFTIPVQYPKAGTTNSAAKVGVVSATGGETTWIEFPGDPREHYIPRMKWAGAPDAIIVQRLNRLQNRNQVALADAETGTVTSLFTERDDAWLDVVDDWTWLDGGERFLWVSERSGWRHVYSVPRDGATATAVTFGEYDVISVELVDEPGGWLYFMASPDDATQRYLYRTRLDGRSPPERVTPAGQPGWHSYDISPDARWAIHSWSRFGVPPTTELIRVRGHQPARSLVDNEELRETVAALERGEHEFFTVEVNGVSLDGWMMRPPDFRDGVRYPVLMYGYTGPFGQTAVDSWGGFRYLWHLMLTQQGYIVATVDNRGTPGPKGRDFRKAIYRQYGQVSSEDQADAVRALLAERSYVDPERIGAWGWSGGGTYTLNMLTRYPDLYSAGMAVAPVTHEKFYDTAYQERYMGLPDENAEGYEQSAPLTFAEQLEGRLLLVHGSGDDNVHVQNTEAMVNELVKHG
ncbi:MAG TPA: DPP IV N-terminal domain-containing protein, partial [Gemmatimonadota bacterium]|nr:DPP IV N-terminal domain-containing protein [Gemmatimonadota bacterium]